MTGRGGNKDVHGTNSKRLAEVRVLIFDLWVIDWLLDLRSLPYPYLFKTKECSGVDGRLQAAVLPAQERSQDQGTVGRRRSYRKLCFHH